MNTLKLKVMYINVFYNMEMYGRLKSNHTKIFKRPCVKLEVKSNNYIKTSSWILFKSEKILDFNVLF